VLIYWDSFYYKQMSDDPIYDHHVAYDDDDTEVIEDGDGMDDAADDGVIPIDMTYMLESNVEDLDSADRALLAELDEFF